MLQEFKDFINRGNFMELAVGFVMGVATKDVIDALVARILMPLVGMLFGQPDLSSVGEFGCERVTDDAGATVTQCAGSLGAVVTAFLNFLLIGLAMFLLVKAYNRFKARHEEPEPAEEPAEPDEITLLREIRDALARR